ncbi:L,D-transpeptidase family protein [Hyphomicrobium sp. DMF-1]|uniref:L,D-transpeptidase family protein n=1 Tax=Hyphomicrobium sp. DMF-1 TaxID=3019544 RepID=UPI0022EBFFDB|nr:L,D-transpeptidase family protein [Hyphomicrobium sp. DMF-1]WBT39691.1 L,D-transpeptidase family protein [Hyphomicrobium sp. DMF-1]
MRFTSPQVSKSGFAMRLIPVSRFRASALRVVWALAAVSCVSMLAAHPAAAQRQRTLPPEPSTVPWVSPPGIQELQGAIAKYQAIVSAGGWPMLPARITLRPGDSDANVAIVRRHLEMTGDMRRGGDAYLFDAALEAGVKRYQLRNGLEPTGIVYGITQRSLNVPAQTRLRQLQLNLARMQELLPKLSAPRQVLMNSASFELQALNGGQVELTSRTIAGKRATPTPTISATLQALNIYPFWHVPGSIAKAALIPAVRKDPSYLYKERIRVFSTFGGEEIDPSMVNWWGPEAERYVFRQDPGPQNALGLIRFDMPNKQIVYMHDTPMKNLFDYYERANSAGCVRVQRYVDLADWLLAGQDGWSRAGIEAALAEGRAKTIKLARPVPVHFIYLTAWAENGNVQFRNDLYNRDDSAFDPGEDIASRTFNMPVAP